MKRRKYGKRWFRAIGQRNASIGVSLLDSRLRVAGPEWVHKAYVEGYLDQRRGK